MLALAIAFDTGSALNATVAFADSC